MPRRKPSPAPSTTLRRHIAGTAARLMAEDGIADYGLAKRKAARQMGFGEGEALPSNAEVESELRQYQALYQEDEQAERVDELRRTALQAMEFLADFRPHLTGAVLDGTAGRYAEIDLDLFADSSKDVEILLLSSNIPYQVDEMRRRGGEAPETRLRLEWEGVPINLLIYPPAAERNAPRHPPHGRAKSRAAAAVVAALLTPKTP